MTDFGWALQQLRAGRVVHRQGWNGKGMWIALQEPANGNKITLPYIYMSTVTDDLVPWVASQTDLLATDWRVVSLAIGGPGLPASYFEEGKRVAEAAREYFKEAEDAEFEEGFEK